MLKLTVKSAAWADIRRAGQWLAKRNPGAAHRFFSAVRSEIDFLRLNPEIGTPRMSLPSVRYWRVKTFSNYLIFYSATDEEIKIIAVLHGARDLSAIVGSRF